MSAKDNTDVEDLNQFIPRPEATTAKRHMVACEPEAYEFITRTAERLKTTRNRVVTALVEFYRAPEA